MNKDKKEACADVITLKKVIPFVPFADLTVELKRDIWGMKEQIDEIRAMDKSDMVQACDWVKYETELTVSGPVVDMVICEQAWEYYRAGKIKSDDFCYAVDEHYYMEPQWMYDHVDLYDDYDRNLYVFAGEYAVHTENRGNNMEAVLAEAALLTGLEKNAGAVKLASYAPLFNRIGHSQWKPDMIWFDATDVVLTPNYYVQKLFANNLGAHTLVLEADGEEPENLPQPSKVTEEQIMLAGNLTVKAESFAVVRLWILYFCKKWSLFSST